MIEDHLLFLLAAEAYVYHGGKHFVTHYPPGLIPLPSFVTKFLFAVVFKRINKKNLYNQGLGRHERHEQQKMGLSALQALSDILGDNKFLMGDQPCEEDCTLFAFICWPLLCCTDDNIYNIEIKKFPRLMAYFERMKEVYWADWKEMRHPSKK